VRQTPRVLVTHPSADLYGSDRVMLESIEGLIAAGANVTVTLPSDGTLVTEIRKRHAEVAFCPTTVLRKSVLRPGALLRLAIGSVGQLRAGLALLRRVRPTVVYVSTITTPLWLVIARIGRVPALCHVHEAEGSARKLVRRALALPLGLARTILTNSRFSSDVLVSARPSLKSRVRVVYNGVPGPPAPTMPRDELVGELRIVYVGRLSPRKGVDLVIEAVAVLAERGVVARAQLVGAVFPGYEWYQEQLSAIVRDRGVTERVDFAGFRPSVWAELDAADVVVVPSRFDEPFGNTAVEAVLAARPLVVSNTSGLREAAADYESAVFVAPDDAPAIADAVMTIAHAWPRYRAAALADRARALERHDPAVYGRTVAQATLAISGGRYAGG
jgi:glycosyltransferase involved in cell wall biosynthesis